jgi:16S rRNA (guanine966-N2)-methyltransferase
MRVIAGKWRGRVLRSPRGDAVRPTADRVKEAMFSILAPHLPGATFIDLCCGAGGLALEALSRGAAGAVLVDTSRASLDTARANLELCRADAATYQLVRADCRRWLRDHASLAEDWIVVADPPYASDLPWAILSAMADLAAGPGFRVGILEHGADDRGLELEKLGESARFDTRRYGQSALTIVRPVQPE